MNNNNNMDAGDFSLVTSLSGKASRLTLLLLFCGVQPINITPSPQPIGLSRNYKHFGFDRLLLRTLRSLLQ